MACGRGCFSRMMHPVRRSRNGPVPAALAIGLAVLALAALGVSAWFLSDTQSDQRRALRDRYSDRTAIAASLIDSLFRVAFTGQQQQAAQQYAGDRISRAQLDATVKRGSQGDTMVVDAQGHGVGGPSRAPRVPHAGLISQATRSAFALSEVRPGRPAVIESAFSFQAPSGVRVVISASPLPVYRSFLDGTIKPLPTLRRSRAYVLDRNGRALGAALSRGRAAANPSPQLLRAIKRHTSASYSVQGAAIFAVTTPIPGTPWRVVSSAAEDELYASVSGLRRWSPWAILVVGALALIAV